MHITPPCILHGWAQKAVMEKHKTVSRLTCWPICHEFLYVKSTYYSHINLHAKKWTKYHTVICKLRAPPLIRAPHIVGGGPDAIRSHLARAPGALIMQITICFNFCYNVRKTEAFNNALTIILWYDNRFVCVRVRVENPLARCYYI